MNTQPTGRVRGTRAVMETPPWGRVPHALRVIAARWCLLAGLGLLAPAPARAGESDAPRRLESRDAAVRAEAFGQLAASGLDAVEPAIALLETDNPDLQLAGRRLLHGLATQVMAGTLAEDEAARLRDALHRLVKPGHSFAARDCALEALELAGTAESVPHIAPALDHPGLRGRTLRVLQRLDTAEARDAVGRAVAEADPTFRPALLLALGDMAEPEGVDSLLVWAQQESEPDAQAAAMAGLARRGVPAALPLLDAARAAAAPGARRDGLTLEVLLLISRIDRAAATFEELESAATAAERIAAEAADPAQACAALDALAKVGTERDALRVALPLAAAADPAVSACSRAALAGWNADITPLLRDVAAGSVAAPPELRPAALAAAIARTPGQARTLLAQAAASDEALVRARALEIAAAEGVHLDWALLDAAAVPGQPDSVRRAARAASMRQAVRQAASGQPDPALGGRLLSLASDGEADAGLRADAAWAAGSVLGAERAGAFDALLADPAVQDGAARGLLAFGARPDVDDNAAQAALRRVVERVASPELVREAGRLLARRGGDPTQYARERGFIVDWWVVGPFPNPDGSAFERAFPPEQTVDTGGPLEFEGRSLAWRAARVTDPLGRLDLLSLFEPNLNVAAYTYTEFSAGVSTNVLLKLGSDDGVVVWLNGEGVHGVNTGRSLQVDQDVVPVTLRAGRNTLLCKVLQGGAGWELCARMTDAQHRSLTLAELAALEPPPIFAPPAPDSFAAARPVWLAGRAAEMNLQAGFRAAVDVPAGGRLELRATASAVYRATVNGRFAGYGPARGPHGWFRIDAWDLTPHLEPGANVVAIEVAGYNVNSYYLLDQPAFLQAELIGEGRRVVAATGAADGLSAFDAIDLTGQRVQRVARYSFQRAFTEVYRLDPRWDAWRVDPTFTPAGGWSAAEPQPAPLGLLPRRIAPPDFRHHGAIAIAGRGRVEAGPPPAAPWKDRSMVNVGPQFKGYPESELETVPSIEIQGLSFAPQPLEEETTAAAATAGPCELPEGAYRVFDLGTNLTGFVTLDVECDAPARLFVTFDELQAGGVVDFKRLGCINLIAYELAPGAYRLESFEPYTLRYLQAIAVSGRCRIMDAGLRTYACGGVETATFAAEDERLERLFAAGRETFRQNALDVFMDCPSRERAGWLCDSFFTARVAPDLTGTTAIEHNFIENFLLPERFAHLPDGMLPMCYPADHPDGVFIPNWAMWFVVQLEEYLERTGDRETVARIEPRVRRLIAFLDECMNEQGLLEHLPSWVFVEWSRANDFTQDVSFPSNMLYAGVLGAAGRLYGDAELERRAEGLRQRIRAMAFDGAFFVDNALRSDTGDLVATQNKTEVCQYFAFFFGVASPEQYPELWRRLTDEFGPRRAEQGLYPEVHPANAFIGNMLRVELLSRAGRPQQILDESIDYLLYMAERTGTLWEMTTPNASCNHGFASHVVHTLYRDILGVRRLALAGRQVEIAIPDLRMGWCAGTLPVPGGAVTVRWSRRADGSVGYRVEAPPDYAVSVRPGRDGLAIAADESLR